MIARQPNTDRNGRWFSQQTVQAVWEKGRTIPTLYANEWRWDICGHMMKRDEHGNRQFEYGWDVDHKQPVAAGGDDNLSNLQPLNWRINARKGDTFPWDCSML